MHWEFSRYPRFSQPQLFLGGCMLDCTSTDHIWARWTRENSTGWYIAQILWWYITQQLANLNTYSLSLKLVYCIANRNRIYPLMKPLARSKIKLYYTQAGGGSIWAACHISDTILASSLRSSSAVHAFMLSSTSPREPQPIMMPSSRRPRSPECR